MSYFDNFSLVEYRFGDEDESQRVLTEDLSIYVDLLDQVDDLISFYENYFIINGERPDALSYKLYGNIDYYWTFFLMNPKLRESGWPLDSKRFDDYVTKRFKGAVFYPTATDDFNLFEVDTKWKYALGTTTSTGTEAGTFTAVLSATTGPAEDPLLDANVAVTDTTGVVAGMNIAGLHILPGTTITAVNYDTNVLTLSQNPTDDYETVDGTFPATFTVWGGSAFDLYVSDYSATDLRIGDYVTGAGIQSESRVASLSSTVITLDKPTTQPYTNETFSLWGGLDVYRNFDFGQICLKDMVRTGAEFHPLVPSITEVKSLDEVSTVSTPSIVIEPNALHHYENGSGEWIDPNYGATVYPVGGNIDITAPTGSIITNEEYTQASNDDIAKIKVIKPERITRLVSEFQRLVKG